MANVKQFVAMRKYLRDRRNANDLSLVERLNYESVSRDTALATAPGVGTVANLGRRTKAKYPEYGGLSDAYAGRRIKAKYPG
jgi:hypothetical protein